MSEYKISIADVIGGLLRSGIYFEHEFRKLADGEGFIASVSWDERRRKIKCEAMPDGSIYSYTVTPSELILK